MRIIRSSALTISALLLSFATTPSVQATPSGVYLAAGDDSIPGQYIVVFNDRQIGTDTISDAQDLSNTYGFEVKAVWQDGVKGFFGIMTHDQALALLNDSRVAYVEENATWYLSAPGTQQTNVNPVTCDPVGGGCSLTSDDRLWHLDRADQNYPDPTNTYSYCTDGTGVTVYVVDYGVNKHHAEFGPDGSRVMPGINVSNDNMPADDPCLGFAVPPTGSYPYENFTYYNEILASGHGTAVASAVGGNRVGIAKNVTIVPVKIARCDLYSARVRLANHFYQANQTMFVTANGAGIDFLYQAASSGTTASADNFSFNWGTTPVHDGGVDWLLIPYSVYSKVETTDMLISGLTWILGANTGPKSNAVVTMSTYRRKDDINGGGSITVETVVKALLASGLTVVASANNQNGDACDTSPARMSRNNPDASVANDVITAGGTMIVNRPWTVNLAEPPANSGVEADGGAKGLEAAFDPTKATQEARWICGSGDSSVCSNATVASTPNPSGDLNTYYQYQGGSNAGACVTLFAPAKNLFLATLSGANDYRDARVHAAQASGTSWSAPIVAGFAARILQNNRTYTASQVRAALLSNSSPTLIDTVAFPMATHDYLGNLINGTPNQVLSLADVNITQHPLSTAAAASGTTPLSVGAGGTTSISYQWYKVNAGFDLVTYKYGAHSSTPISGATSSTYSVPVSTSIQAYWARIGDSCGSADSKIAVVVPAPGAPSNVIATAGASGVTVTWSGGSGADEYEVQRKVSGLPWVRAALVHGGTFTETPSAPGGMIVYRVRSVAGTAFLGDGAWALSAFASPDFANLNGTAYELLTTQTTVKAQHLIELRQAVNALCDAVGAGAEFQAGDLALASLKGNAIQASDLTSLMTHINNIRTNAVLGMAASSFSETPARGLAVKRAHLQSLRDALN